MKRIFNKNRRRLLLSKKSGKSESSKGRYLLYALGEMFLIVTGILIALQINNWNTRRIEKATENKIYENIKRQITDDKNELMEVKELNNYYGKQYNLANEIILSKNFKAKDTLAFIAMNLSQYSDFYRSGNIYETLVNSGEIRLLKNSVIISQLQKLEMIYTNINRLEDIHWEIIINELSPELKGIINYSTMEIIMPNKLYSVEIQNILIESIYITKGKDSLYRKAINEIISSVKIIDNELNNN